MIWCVRLRLPVALFIVAAAAAAAAHANPPGAAVQRFVRVSNLGEQAVLAHAAAALDGPRLARAACEADVVAKSRDLFDDFAAAATRTVFAHDHDGSELHAVTTALASPAGRDYLAAQAEMARDVVDGMDIGAASARMRARLTHLTPAMALPIRRSSAVLQLLQDPQRFEAWPRHPELQRRLRTCRMGR